MPTNEFLRKTTEVAYDPAIILFCGLISLPLTFGITVLDTLAFLVVAIMMILFSTSAIMKYATLVTRALALGQPVPRAESSVFEYFSMLRAFAPWVSLTLLFAIGLIINMELGSAATWFYAIVVSPLVPAVIAVVSVNMQPLSMFRLPGLFKVISIMGADYLKLLACWALTILPEALRWSPVPDLPLFFVCMLVLLQMMLLFVASGVLLFHHRDALGLPVEREEKSVRMQRNEDAITLKERNNVLGLAYTYFSRDNAVGGLKCVRDYLQAHDDHDTWQWFIDRMHDWESRQPMLMLSRNYFSHLVAADERAKAADLLLSCMTVDQGFTPHPDDRAYARALLSGHAYAPLADNWR
ncbi:MAG: hypothetical protein AAF004_10420 [Pseudomonadota bacterium]